MSIARIRTELVIDVGDWDQLVIDTYGRPYSFQQQDGCKERQRVRLNIPDQYADDYENETVPEIVNHDEMGVSFEAWLARDPKQPLESEPDYRYGTTLWWERNFYPVVEMIGNDLFERGLIEAGEYTIDIDW